MGDIRDKLEAMSMGGLGGGIGAATATPYNPHAVQMSEEEKEAIKKNVEKEAVVSGFKPEYAASEEPDAKGEEAAPAAEGAVLAAGWLKKTGKGLKAKVFESCWVTLRDEPLLAFHQDESLKAEKGGALSLVGGTVKREEDIVVVSTPAEAVVGVTAKRVNVLKLQAEGATEADLWVARIEAAIAGEPQPPAPE